MISQIVTICTNGVGRVIVSQKMITKLRTYILWSRRWLFKEEEVLVADLDSLTKPAEYDARQKQAQVAPPPLAIKSHWPKPNQEDLGCESHLTQQGSMSIMRRRTSC